MCAEDSRTMSGGVFGSYSATCMPKLDLLCATVWKIYGGGVQTTPPPPPWVNLLQYIAWSSEGCEQTSLSFKQFPLHIPRMDFVVHMFVNDALPQMVDYHVAYRANQMPRKGFLWHEMFLLGSLCCVLKL